MNCPKCHKPYERKSSTGTGYDVYEHASRNENGFRVVSSSDCCYVRRPTRTALDGRVRGAKKRTGSKPARK